MVQKFMIQIIHSGECYTWTERRKDTLKTVSFRIGIFFYLHQYTNQISISFKVHKLLLYIDQLHLDSIEGC